MLVSHADAKMLKKRAQAKHDIAAGQEAELLWAGCFIVAIRMMSDSVEAHTVCPSGRCRRRRGCVGLPFRCSSIIRERGINHDISRLIDGLYWIMMEKLGNGQTLDEDADHGRLS